MHTRYTQKGTLIMQEETLFNKYGGLETFGAVVNSFYQKVLDSEQLEPFFQNIDIERLMSHQTNFIAKALGGPDQYAGKDIDAAHANLNISTEHFMEVADLLSEALDEAGVEEEDIETIIGIIASLKNKIVHN